MNELEEANEKIKELEKENNKLENNASYWQNKAEKLEGKLYNEETEIIQISVEPRTSFSDLTIFGLGVNSKVYFWDDDSCCWRLNKKP